MVQLNNNSIHKCIKCDCVLIPVVNWIKSFVKRKKYVCRDCNRITANAYMNTYKTKNKKIDDEWKL